MTKKNTKRALFASVISMLLCVTMLIGSTFAWFTDNSATSVNTIQAGTLRVELVDSKGNSLEGQTLDFNMAGENKLWEPGSRWSLKDIYVKNNGTLDLKYNIVITGIKGNAKLNEAIDWTITLGGKTVDLTNAEFTLKAGATSVPLSISAVMRTDAGNEYQGLAIDGIAIAVQATQTSSESDSIDNTYDSTATYGEDYVAGGDGTTADTNVMQTVTIDDVSEFLTFATAVTDGTEYKGVKVANNRNVTVQLSADIDLTNATGPSANAGQVCIGNGSNTLFQGVFDGQNHTISNLTLTGNWTYSCSLFRTVGDGFTMKDVKFTNATNTVDGRKTGGVGVIVGLSAGGSVTFNNVDVEGATVNGRAAVGVLIGKCQQTTTLVVQNCDLKDCTVSTSSYSSAQPATIGAFAGSFEDVGLNGNAPANLVTANNTMTNCVDGDGDALTQVGAAY